MDWEQNAKDLAKLRDELYEEMEKLRVENIDMRSTLQSIANLAPIDEPPKVFTQAFTPSHALSSAYSFWYAGQTARETLKRLT
jgi:hypothetical protein